MCSVEGCGRKVKTRGWCGAHYVRWRKTGEVGSGAIEMRSTIVPGSLCTVDGCANSPCARGLCRKHYELWRKNGDPTIKRNMIGVSLRERFEANLPATRGPESCWQWQGATINGYGVIREGHGSSRVLGAHRAAYELSKGRIPDDLTIDHLCHNADRTCDGGASCLHRRCVNPSHLEAVTHVVNVLRGQALSARNLRKTHCPKGHEFTEENTYHSNTPNGRGQRKCRACVLVRAARYREAQKA